MSVEPIGRSRQCANEAIYGLTPLTTCVTNTLPPLSGGYPSQLLLYDRHTGGLRQISRDVAGTTGADQDAYGPVLSEDGRRVFFISHASNLVPESDDNGSLADVFVHDIAANTNALVSHNRQRTATALYGCGGFVSPQPPVVSSNGVTVMFGTSQTNLFRLPSRVNCQDNLFFRRLEP